MSVTGLQLKRALKINGITQQDAADRLHKTRQTVIEYCKRDFLTNEIVQEVESILKIKLEDYNPEAESLGDLKHKNELLEKEVEKLNAIIDGLAAVVRTKDELIDALRSQFNNKGGDNITKQPDRKIG